MGPKPVRQCRSRRPSAAVVESACRRQPDTDRANRARPEAKERGGVGEHAGAEQPAVGHGRGGAWKLART